MKEPLYPMNLRLGWWCIATWSATVLTAHSEPLAAEDLFKTPDQGEAWISPDGKHVGAIVTENGDVRSLVLYDLKDYSPTALRGWGEFEITHFRWVSDNRIILQSTYDKIWMNDFYSVRIDRMGDLVSLGQFPIGQLIGAPKARRDHVIVALYRPFELDAAYHPLANRELAASQAIVRSYSWPDAGTPALWFGDREGEVALCRTWDKDRFRLFRYLASSSSWKEVPVASGVMPMGVDYDAKYIWVVIYDPPKGFELRRCQLETGLMESALLTDPTYNPASGFLTFSDASRALAGITYLQKTFASYYFLRPYALAQATINKAEPGTDNVMVDHDLAEKKFVFRLTGPTHPSVNVLLDLGAKTERSLGDPAPWLKGKVLRPVQPLAFKARDGLSLEGYAGIPEGASALHQVPLVVLAHGGPWLRNDAEFSPEVQFFLSRGYAVLQVNYRGSVGYVPAVSEDQKFDFEKMRQDVADATRAFIRTGLIDTKRVAIMGGSFGGYLAVAEAAFEKDLYCCAITEAGVFDWKKQFEQDRSRMRRGDSNQLFDELDKPGGQFTGLDDISPMGHTDKIHIPMLIAHGDNDAQVDVLQSEHLVRALKRQGVPVDTFIRPIEGHGFFRYENRVAFYRKVEAFLETNMKGAAPAVPR